MSWIKRQISKHSLYELVGVVTAGIGLATGGWAYFADWFSSDWAPLTPLVFLAIAVLGLVAAERISAWRARAPWKHLSQIELRDLIQQWLIDYQFSVTHHPLTDPDLAFGFTAVGEDKLEVQITYVEKENMLVISAFYQVPERWFSEFDDLTGRASPTMLQDVRIELSHFEIAYSGVIHPLRTIALSDRMLYDETFNKTRLLDKVIHVFAAYTAIEAIIGKAANIAYRGQENTRPTPDI